MRKHVVIALIICMILSGGVYAQYSGSLKNKGLNQFFELVRSQSELSYSYEFDEVAWLPYMQAVNLSLSDAPLDRFLKQGLMNQPFTWYIQKNILYVTPKPITGTVLNEKNEPVAGATISIAGTDSATATNARGEFTLHSKRPDITLIISSVNHEPLQLSVSGRAPVQIMVKTKTTVLQEASHDAETGYQNIPRTRITGSYEKPSVRRFIDNASPNALSNLQWMGASLLFSHDASGANLLGITIRGRSTLHLNTDPLVVIDNWPWEGDIRNIRLNPNVVENITILKDAAATAIWGARAGNGVIVITTKKGKSQQPSVQFISNLGFTERPDLFYAPALPSTGFIDFETELFNKGVYDARQNSASLVSPVIDILFRKKKGLIDATEANAQIDALRSIDNRYDLNKYFYRTGINQQYTVNVSGHSNIHELFFSAAHERNMSNIVNSGYNQTTLFSNGQLSPVKNLKIGGSVQYIHNRTLNNDPPPSVRWPYEKLADEQGNPLPVYADLRQSYKDTAGHGLLADWNYRPLDEIRQRRHVMTTTNLRMEAQLQFRFARYFQLKLLGLYASETGAGRNYMDPELYYVRNLVNSFTNLSSGSPVHPIPYSGILDESDTRSETRNQRLQVDYDQAWNKHQVSAIMGIEQRYTDSRVIEARRYGYDPVTRTEVLLNHDTTWPMVYSANIRKPIPGNSNTNFNKDYFCLLSQQPAILSTTGIRYRPVSVSINRISSDRPPTILLPRCGRPAPPGRSRTKIFTIGTRCIT